MATFRLTRKAREDLKSIARYTQKTWGISQRNKYLMQLDKRFALLAETPSLGRSCDAIRPGYRKYHEGRHVIFYVLIPGGSRSFASCMTPWTPSVTCEARTNSFSCFRLRHAQGV